MNITKHDNINGKFICKDFIFHKNLSYNGCAKKFNPDQRLK